MDPARTLSSAARSARSVDKRTQLERVEEVREEREREKEAWAMDKEANVQLRTVLKQKDEEGAGMILRAEQEREERKERERLAEQRYLDSVKEVEDLRRLMARMEQRDEERERDRERERESARATWY